MKEKKILQIFFVYIASIIFVLSIITLLISRYLALDFTLSLLLSLVFSIFATSIITLIVSHYNEITRLITTNRGQISRLENLNNPLMVKLSKQAAGTYSHCLAVAELSQNAGSSLSLDPSLMRVGGYYHDIGKLATPSVFIENQQEIPANTDLKKIARQIIDHVRVGVKIARENHFPDEVIDIISQHHGTSEIESLKKDLEKEGIKLEYPGPKPLSREAAIVMLADCVEARIRSKSHLSDEALIREIEGQIVKKIRDGQLDLSGLSSNDIQKIKKNFFYKIKSIYHNRKLYKR